jgi:hypothetical protein
MLATPLLREGAPIGVITIRHRGAAVLRQADRAAGDCPDQAVIAIENVRLFQSSRRHPDLAVPGETGALSEVILRQPSLDLREILDTVARRAVALGRGRLLIRAAPRPAGRRGGEPGPPPSSWTRCCTLGRDRSRTISQAAETGEPADPDVEEAHGYPSGPSSAGRSARR